jgi:hypothetical protein
MTMEQIRLMNDDENAELEARRSIIEHIAAQLQELIKLCGEKDLPMVCYLLRMALLETQTLLKNKAPAQDC